MLAARGKTSEEFSLIMSIAERTVNFNLNNARDKLGVATRIQAAVKATIAGFIEPWVITYPHFWGRFLRLQARVSRIVWKGFTPLSLAVSTVVRTSASARAAHIAR